MTDVVLRGVSKTYSAGVKAVADLDFQVFAGELLVLVGPSGSGKSTTLRLIAGLERPSAGSIHFGGEEVTLRPAHRREAAVVFQTPGLFPFRTVRQNLELGLQPPISHFFAGWFGGGGPSSGETRRQVDATARLLGIEHLLARLPGDLSGGERQRVALGRALIQQPKVFLLDEPLVHLDPDLRHELRKEIRRRQSDGRITTIFVSHDPAEAMAIADRIGVLHAGRLLQLGRPADVYDHPADTTVARIFGPRPMNLVHGRWSGEESRFKVGGWSFTLPPHEHPVSRQEKVIWGVRPEDLRVDGTGGALGSGTVVGRAEFAGDQVFVTVQPTGTDVLLDVQTVRNSQPAEGAQVTLRVQPGRSRWFAEDGKRL